MEFETGYLFGKVLGKDKYILMDCQPNEHDTYGIVLYEYGNADFIRLTKEELDKLNNGDASWIDHDNMIAASDCGYFVADTIGEAIVGFQEKSGILPELYMRNSKDGSMQFQRIYNMSADEINNIVGTDALRSLYYYDTDLDAFSHVCGDSYNI